MKKKIRKHRVMRFTIFICALLMLQTNVYAQGTMTEAQVAFQKGEGPTSPVDPDDPDVPGNGGADGSFLIVTVSYFDFGSVKIEPVRQWLDIETSRPNIQVVDLRGSNAGWRVSATVSRFEDADRNPSLPGAVINIYDGRPKSNSVSAEPEQIKGLQLTADGESFRVIKAEQGAGAGLWVMRWYPKIKEDAAFVQLEIPPGSATLGSHTATIDWILEDGPTK